MCTLDDDCSLLGVCRAGVCACRPPWVGAHCERIAFLPARPTGLNLLASNTSTWGGDTLERPHPIHDAAGTLVALSTAVTAMPTTCVGRPHCLYRWPDASYTLVQSTAHTQ